MATATGRAFDTEVTKPTGGTDPTSTTKTGGSMQLGGGTSTTTDTTTSTTIDTTGTSSSSGSKPNYNYGITTWGIPTGDIPATTTDTTQKQSTTSASKDQVYDLNTNAPTAYKLPEVPTPSINKIDHVSSADMESILQQLTDSQKQQSDKSIDYSVQQSVNELNRAMEDAADDYQTQRDQVAASEAQALDNQALYAETRGDRGGIGQAQYASIQNSAAQNMLTVNQAQTQLATDTARQVEDLRAQGEFQKADNLLSITQSYLSQLLSLKQWAIETNLSVDEFNTQLDEWLENFKMSAQQYLTSTELSAAELTGMFADGTRTRTAQNELIDALANSGSSMLNAGIMPTAQQLEAMGMTEAQAQLYLAQLGY
jgi:hypothetical protein